MLICRHWYGSVSGLWHWSDREVMGKADRWRRLSRGGRHIDLLRSDLRLNLRPDRSSHRSWQVLHAGLGWCRSSEEV